MFIEMRWEEILDLQLNTTFRKKFTFYISFKIIIINIILEWHPWKIKKVL